MKTCSTCKHWAKEADCDGIGGIKLLRTCEKIPMFENATEWTEEYDGRKLKDRYLDVLAFAQDGSGYIAYLTTLPTFGCVMYED